MNLTLTLSGIAWRATSPSRYELVQNPDIVLFYDGALWRFDFGDGIGQTWEHYPSRDVAARALADGINAYRRKA